VSFVLSLCHLRQDGYFDRLLSVRIATQMDLQLAAPGAGGRMMERNVVSLKTAKKLKAAGFPGVSMWHYADGIDPSDELFFAQFSGLTQLDIAAPTAQEVADQLPRKIGDYCLFLEYGDDGTLWACYRVVDSKADYMLYAEAETMAEALALLWLKINEPQ
jgi:hypothetical protein